VTLRYHSLSVKVDFVPDLIPLSYADVQYALSFEGTQRLFLHIKGIRLHDDPDSPMLPFVKHDDLSFVLDGWPDPSLVYDVIVEDNRVSSFHHLSEEDIATIKRKFRRIDIDQSGFIDFDEARLYYSRMERTKREDALYELKKKLGGTSKAYKKLKKRIVANSKALIDAHIAAFLEADIDKNGNIDFEEFLLHEARLLKGDV